MPACVLVADDDPAVRSMTALCLEGLGLRALCAGSGEEAVELCLCTPGEVSLVLLDLNMPGRGGRAALEALRGVAPGLPVLLVSGDADRLTADDVLGAGACGVLAKPFGLAELRAALSVWLPRPAC